MNQIELRLWLDAHENINASTESIIEQFEKTLKAFESALVNGYKFNEIALSQKVVSLPEFLEQFYSSKSFVAILELKKLHSFSFKNVIAFDNQDGLRKIQECTSFILKKNSEIEIVIELQVDIKRLLADKVGFLREVKEIFQIQKEGNPNQVKVYFVAQSQEVDFLQQNLQEILGMWQEGTCGFFEVTVSYINNFNIEENFLDQIKGWKLFFYKINDPLALRYLTLPFAEKNKHSLGEMAFLLDGDELYHMPNVYNLISHGFENLKVREISAENLGKGREELIASQLMYADYTHLCSQCNNLISCTGNYVLSVMELQKIKDCVFPEKLINALDIY